MHPHPLPDLATDPSLAADGPRAVSPAVTETRVIHEVHRRATSLLASVTRPSPEVSELRDFVIATLEHHHAREDEDLWPMLVERAPHLRSELARLTGEHVHLQVALDDLHAAPLDATGRVPAAVRLRDLVHEHLAHEEPVLLPALADHLDDDGWDRFSARAVATAPPAGLPLLIALVYEVGSPAEAEVVFRHVPPEARATIPERRMVGERTLADLRWAEA